jgi:hypothetical protein
VAGNADLLVAEAAKLKARNERIRFLNSRAHEVMDSLPSLSPERSEAPLVYDETLVAKIKDANDPAKYAALDPVAVLDGGPIGLGKIPNSVSCFTM